MKNFKQFTRDNEPLILEGPMWDSIKAGASSALASAKAGTSSLLAGAKNKLSTAGTAVKNYATSGTAFNHAKAVGRGIGDVTTGTANVVGNVLNKTTQVAGKAIQNVGSGVIGGVMGGLRTGGNNGGGSGSEKDSPKEAAARRTHELALATANKPSSDDISDARAHAAAQSQLDREHKEKIARLELLASRNRSQRRRKGGRPASGTP